MRYYSNVQGFGLELYTIIFTSNWLSNISVVHSYYLSIYISKFVIPLANIKTNLINFVNFVLLIVTYLNSDRY